MKKFYCVTSAVDNYGRCTAARTHGKRKERSDGK